MNKHRWRVLHGPQFLCRADSNTNGSIRDGSEEGPFNVVRLEHDFRDLGTLFHLRSVSYPSQPVRGRELRIVTWRSHHPLKDLDHTDTMVPPNLMQSHRWTKAREVVLLRVYPCYVTRFFTTLCGFALYGRSPSADVAPLSGRYRRARASSF